MYKSLCGGWSSCSRKDLKACAKQLLKVLNKKSFQQCIEHFNMLKLKQRYLGYTTNVHGLSPHQGMVCARRPYKSYTYVVDCLKGLKGCFKDLKNVHFKEVIINSTSKRRPRGYKKRDRTKENQKFKLILRITHE